VIGPAEFRYIGLECASIKLLAHSSPTAQKKFIDERGSVLTIPDDSKKSILWIKYMQAGEKDHAGLATFDVRTALYLYD
jgi:hypothetical protein